MVQSSPSARRISQRFFVTHCPLANPRHKDHTLCPPTCPAYLRRSSIDKTKALSAALSADRASFGKVLAGWMKLGAKKRPARWNRMTMFPPALLVPRNIRGFWASGRLAEGRRGQIYGPESLMQTTLAFLQHRWPNAQSKCGICRLSSTPNTRALFDPVYAENFGGQHRRICYLAAHTG